MRRAHGTGAAAAVALLLGATSCMSARDDPAETDRAPVTDIDTGFDAVDAAGWTPLIRAAIDDEAAVRALVAAGADPSVIAAG